jgi:hypothetical protein
LTTKELAVASRQGTVTRFLFHQEFLTENKMIAIPHPAYFSFFPQLKTELKGRHFGTIEVIEAEWKAVLNTSQNMTSRIRLKKTEGLGRVHTRGRGLLGR